MADAGESEITKAKFDAILEEFGGSGEMDKETFIRWMTTFTKKIGERKMYTYLEKWGYDCSLYSFKERVFVLTVHSRVPHLSMNMRNMVGSGLS